MVTMDILTSLFLLLVFPLFRATAFAILPVYHGHHRSGTASQQQQHSAKDDRARSTHKNRRYSAGAGRPSTTSLNLLLDVPDQFFTFTFPMLGILLGISKNYARAALEEAAWEQRLAEARAERLAQDPTLTELDLRRQEAANEWSAYGVPRLQELAAAQGQQQSDVSSFGRRQRRVSVINRDSDESDDDAIPSAEYDPRDYRMTSDEIAAFEREYGIEYDAYYDEPYAADELPEGEYDLDRLYGDRIYKETGEIFYRDASTGLFWRQGSKPRNIKFF